MLSLLDLLAREIKKAMSSLEEYYRNPPSWKRLGTVENGIEN
jgi:hypothetical protein